MALSASKSSAPDIADPVRAARQCKSAGKRSKWRNHLESGSFRALIWPRWRPFWRLQVGNFLTARNRLDFVLTAKGLYRDCIRGARAPASLKPVTSHDHAAVRAMHPGRARPGLIEAPAVHARARIQAVHPGRARPGLIEARPDTSRHAPGREGHPGRARPGLIEAVGEGPGALGAGRASGARAPRPH